MLEKKRALPPPPDAIANAVKYRMAEILALIEAIAAAEPNCDIQLAKLLENENEQVRIAIVEKLRELIRARAAEKERELNQYIEASQRQKIEQQRNIFLQWLRWMMPEETLRRIRDLFVMQPSVERSVRNIGAELFAKGITGQVQHTGKNELGEIATNAPHLQPGQQKGADRERV